MIHYLKSAIRSLNHNKSNTLINVVGISVGLTCCIIISLHVYQEFNYDRFHTDADRIYRICYLTEYENGSYNSTLHPLELSERLKNEIPQIEYSTAYRYSWTTTLKYEDQFFTEKVAFAEPDFFAMFSFRLLNGNPQSLLTNPNEVVITSDVADKLLSNEDVNYSDLIGESIEFPNETGNELFTIVGILEEIPTTSSMEFSILLPFDFPDNFGESNNPFGNCYLYIKLRQESDIAQVSGAASTAILSFYAQKIKEMQDDNLLVKSNACFVPVLQPLKDVYLDSRFDNDYTKRGSKRSLYILIGIGSLILIIGCFNFILLSLGQALKRSKFIGIRKVVGARESDIFRYLFSEAIVIAFVALIIGILGSYFLLPLYSRFAQIQVQKELFLNPVIILVILLVYFFIVLIDSIIPAILFSRTQPVYLIGNLDKRGTKSKIPFVFVSLQYSLSIVLIISSLFIFNQVKYMKFKDMGFISENILCLRMGDMPVNQRLFFRDQLKNHPGIIDVSGAERDFTGGRSTNYMQKENGENVSVRFMGVDENYIQTLGLQLTAGEKFSVENASDYDNSIIVNEKFIASMDIKDNPIGKIVKSPDLPFDVKIIGVIKDFHYDSMKEPIQPLALYTNTQFASLYYLFVRFNSQSIADVLPFIDQSWDKIVPDRKAQISFWDRTLASRYQEEERWSKIISFASILSVMITSLGLVGLTILIIGTRTKEIGIRKVNGARVSEVMTMLNMEFLTWVVIAFVIATPIAWYAMNKWLQNFAYRTGLSWWVFALAGILALGIALLTVSWQSYRAANRNPIEALRYE